MRKIWISIILLFILCAIPLTAFAADTLIPVGQVVGLQLQNGTVTVSDLAEDSPAKAAGVQSGDCILRIDGKAKPLPAPRTFAPIYPPAATP